MKIRAFITHKMCEQYADCQDRFCINEDNRCIALSDGMSQSIFPDYWAEILAEQYAKEGHCDDDDRKRLCSLWIQRVIKYRDEQIELGKDPWKLDNFLASRKGAGATICGVRFENATDWKGDVLGDSCIIKINTKDWTIEILTSEEKAFDSFPDFYDSFPEKLGRGIIKSVEGSISPDDILLLVSDPFSEYFYKNKEQTEELIGQILKIANHKDYCKLVDDWRAKGMHNDDSTLCIIEFDGDINMNVNYRDYISNLMEVEKKEEKVEISVVQNEVLLNKESSEQKIVDTIEEKESKEIKISQSSDLQAFFYKVINELDKLISRYNRRKSLPNKDNIKKHDIMEIRERLTTEYKNLTTSD